MGIHSITLVALRPITCVAQDAAPSPSHVSLQAKQQLESIKSVAPRARRIGLLVGAAHNIGAITTATQQAKILELQLITATVSNREKIPETLKRLLPQIDLLWLLPDHQMVITEELLSFLLESTFDAKIPLFGFFSTLVQRGALGVLAIDPLYAGQQAGRLATALLHTPSNTVMRLVQPDRTRLALNLSTADFWVSDHLPISFKWPHTSSEGPEHSRQRLIATNPFPRPGKDHDRAVRFFQTRFPDAQAHQRHDADRHQQLRGLELVLYRS